MMRLASVLMVAVLLSTCAIFSTFAKYASISSGNDTARVATWSIKVSGTEIGVAGNTNVAFDLFKTVKDTAGADEIDVAKESADDNIIIAPGTSGSFGIVIKNDSEVNAKYTITLAETNESNIPLKYSVDGTNWVDSVAELAMGSLKDVAINMNNQDTKTVYWKWAFEGTDPGAHANQDDESDTLLGYNHTATVTITATIAVEQVD